MCVGILFAPVIPVQVLTGLLFAPVSGVRVFEIQVQMIFGLVLLHRKNTAVLLLVVFHI